MNKKNLIISCEHASNFIPKKYQFLFRNKKEVLQTHRGWDIGADWWASELAAKYKINYFRCNQSRLLIEVNRSLRSKNIWSEFSSLLPESEKKKILEEYYLPHWEKLEDSIENKIKKNNLVLHLGIHSFTPTLNGITRNCDIGILFDPKRRLEKEFCNDWLKQLKNQGYVVRKNYPYLGKSDGLITQMRKKFKSSNYVGVEVEINQKLSQNLKLKNSIADLLFNGLDKTFRKSMRV